MNSYTATTPARQVSTGTELLGAASSTFEKREENPATIPDATGYSGMDSVESSLLHDLHENDCTGQNLNAQNPAAADLRPRSVSRMHRATSVWASSVLERRLRWLMKKHPKMDRQQLELWAFGPACKAGR
jgi:hypothetical protein